MNEEDTKKKVVTELSKIKSKKGAYTFVTQSEDYRLVNHEIMRFLTKNAGYSGIYVTLSKRHCDIVENLEDDNINTQKMMFIDNLEGKKGCGAKNCIFIGNNSLTALSLAMSEAATHKEMKFLFFDSITTLLIYEKSAIVEKFVHFFLNKIKNLDILMIMMAVREEKTEKIIPIFEQFCEKVIRI